MLKTTAMIILLKTYFGMHCLNMSDSHWNSSSLQVELWSTFSKSVLLNKSSFIIKSSFYRQLTYAFSVTRGKLRITLFIRHNRCVWKRPTKNCERLNFLIVGFLALGAHLNMDESQWTESGLLLSVMLNVKQSKSKTKKKYLSSKRCLNCLKTKVKDCFASFRRFSKLDSLWNMNFARFFH